MVGRTPVALPEQDVRRLYEEVRTVAEIAAAVGVSRRAVTNCLRRMGIEPRTRYETVALRANLRSMAAVGYQCDQGCNCILCRIEAPLCCDTAHALSELAARLSERLTS